MSLWFLKMRTVFSIMLTLLSYSILFWLIHTIYFSVIDTRESDMTIRLAL